MIAKKNSRYDLERKRIVFFQVGLFVTGAFTLAAFTYKTPIEADNRKKEVAYDRIEIFEEDVKEVPKKVEVVREMPKPQSSQSNPTVVAQPILTGAVDPTRNSQTNPITGVGVNTGNLTIGEFNDPGGVIIDLEKIEPWPAREAEYIGGYEAMVNFIKDNINFPQDAIELEIQGKVYLSFVIEKDGSVSNVEIERGVLKSVDREAARIVRSFPNWKPAEMATGKVRSRVRIPINFVLE